jgi:hypothetical protein
MIDYGFCMMTFQVDLERGYYAARADMPFLPVEFENRQVFETFFHFIRSEENI